MRQSSLTVTYKDLAAWVKKQGAYAKLRQSSSVGRGITNQEVLSHDVACAEKLARMLAECEPGRQADMYALFNQTR